MAQSNDALAALRDIHLPEAVSLWPLAPGWWVLLATTTAAIAVLLLLWRRRRHSARHAALVGLAAAEDRFRSDGDARALATALSNLLRRVALLRFPRRDVASLHGEAWLRFLGTRSKRAAFPAEALHTLERCLYGPARTDDADAAEAWIAATGAWIRRIT